MKKKFVKVLSLYLFSSTCFACTTNIDNLVVGITPIVESTPSIITEVKATTHFLGWGNVGDTTIRVKADKEILPALTGKKVDLAPITSNLEGGFRMISVGGSLSAGFKDGGLYREGQLTSFPNLIARQMEISFYQPLFDANEGNGSGYKTLAGTEPIATFKMVTNNLGYANSKADKLKPFTGNNIDQYAFPGMNTALGYTPNDKVSEKFASRFFNKPQNVNYTDNYDLLKTQSCDFFVFEVGIDDIVAGILAGGGGGITTTDPYAGTLGLSLVHNLVDKKSKGVLLTVPDALDFPYFNQITNDKIEKLGVSLSVQRSFGSENYRDYDPLIDKLMPTTTVEKLFKGEFKGEVKLKDEDVLSKDPYDDEWLNSSPIYYNEYKISRIGKANNLPVVDIYGLYKKIVAGTYTTDDGVKVNTDWAKGNFFSADGIYPTAFGQAVIANEVIRTINQNYKLSIPLIQTRFFLNK